MCKPPLIADDASNPAYNLTRPFSFLNSMNLKPTILLALVALAAARPPALGGEGLTRLPSGNAAQVEAPGQIAVPAKGPPKLTDANKSGVPKLNDNIGPSQANKHAGPNIANKAGGSKLNDNIGQSIKPPYKPSSVDIEGPPKPKLNDGFSNSEKELIVRPIKRRALEATAKRFHAHNRQRRSRVFPKRNAPSDIDILNFALSLEHLVSAFYKFGLDKYGPRKFREAGYPGWTRRRYEQLAKNSRMHVQFLESALGEKAVKACRYDLKDKGLSHWIDTSFVAENIAASAWNGFVGILQDRAYQTVAASIMGVKARHAAWINSVVRKSNGWNTAFETPLDMNQIYSIISPFIIPGSCPSANAPLRVTPFPNLRVPPCHPGSIVKLEYESPANVKDAQLFAAFVSGTGTVFVSMREGKVEVPKGLVGIVYVFVTKDSGKVGTEGIVAGPGVVWFGFRA